MYGFEWDVTGVPVGYPWTLPTLRELRHNHMYVCILIVRSFHRLQCNPNKDDDVWYCFFVKLVPVNWNENSLKKCMHVFSSAHCILVHTDLI